MSKIEPLQIDLQLANLSAEAAPLSMGDAMMRVTTWTDLPPNRLRDLRSALSTMARWIGRPANDVPLTPAALRQHVLCMSATAFSVSPGRKTNVKSDVGFVMQRLGLIDETADALSDAWAALLGPMDPHKAINLKRFARFCHERGIAADAVRSETFAAFEVHLITRTLAPRPKKLAGETRGSWNRASRTVAGWPTALPAKCDEPRQYPLPLGDFTPSFQDDVAAFGKHLEGSVLDDLYSEDTGADFDMDDERPLPKSKPLAASTVAGRMAHARWAASALAATGVALSGIHDLGCLVAPIENARTILRYLHVRAGQKPSSAGHHVADVLRIIARHYVSVPVRDVEKIKRWGKPVQLHYTGMTEKNGRTVREVMVPSREAKLLLPPVSLMKAARKLRIGAPQQAASIAMRALAIELLTKIPLRLANFTGIRLDKHLYRTDLRSSLFTHVDFEVDEVKNKRALSSPLSRSISAMIDEWIKDFRPAIAMPGSPFLFPGANSISKPISPQGMRDAVKAVTMDHLGVTVTPHQFRHLAARIFLDTFPGHYEEVRQMLGHANAAVTERSYAGIERESAIRRYDEVLSARLKVLRTTHRKPGRGR